MAEDAGANDQQEIWVIDRFGISTDRRSGLAPAQPRENRGQAGVWLRAGLDDIEHLTASKADFVAQSREDQDVNPQHPLELCSHRRV